jgi:hypothetical protein
LSESDRPAESSPHEHEGETASWAGNSTNVTHRHYKALVKEADAKEFWEITPDNVGQIIPMPTQAAVAARQDGPTRRPSTRRNPAPCQFRRCP